MFSFHKPKVYRSTQGCCICKAKSSRLVCIWRGAIMTCVSECMENENTNIVRWFCNSLGTQFPLH